MEWQKVLESLIASGPLGGGSVFVAYKLWSRLMERESQLETMQKEHAVTVERLQEARIKDLREMITSSRSDD